MANYIALLRKNADSDFGVEFPDFPGCVTAASTLDEALNAAHEALAFHIEGLLEDGEAMPPARPLEEIMSNQEYEGCVSALVSAPVGKGKIVRINITINEYLLEAIDSTVKIEGSNRSAFLSEAARFYIGHHHSENTRMWGAHLRSKRNVGVHDHVIVPLHPATNEREEGKNSECFEKEENLWSTFGPINCNCEKYTVSNDMVVFLNNGIAYKANDASFPDQSLCLFYQPEKESQVDLSESGARSSRVKIKGLILRSASDKKSHDISR